MTAFHKRSRGCAHSLKIKQSPGWARYQAERNGMTLEEWTAYDEAMAKAKAARALKKRDAEPRRRALLAALRFDFAGVQTQLRETFIRGYIRALKDVKRERERQEQASYAEALGSVTMQEAVAMSARYDRRHRAA